MIVTLGCVVYSDLVMLPGMNIQVRMENRWRRVFGDALRVCIMIEYLYFVVIDYLIAHGSLGHCYNYCQRYYLYDEYLVS